MFETTLFENPFPEEFRLERRLGHGAFGEVWLAEDLSPLGRMVALKFLRPSADPEKFARALAGLKNEARILASIRHPNIVQVHAWKDIPTLAQSCLVMQYVPGGSLETLLAGDGPLKWCRAARYIADVAEGLWALHQRGIIHRDVKPANILYDPDLDEALLTDFGIAARMIDTKTIAGTGLYMAPEAHLGDISPKLDVFSLTATLFCLITGQPPFDGKTKATLIEAVARGLCRDDARLNTCPQEMRDLLRKGLAYSPEDRPTLKQFMTDLRSSLNLLLTEDLDPDHSGEAVVHLYVSRSVGANRYTPIGSTLASSELTTSDMRRVTAAPAAVNVYTSEHIRIEVEIEQPGYLVVFNVGPTGNLSLMYPAQVGGAPTYVPTSKRIPVAEAVLTPPVGRERLFAVWSKDPLPVRLETLHSLAMTETQSPAYHTTRDMVRVKQVLETVPNSERQVVVLELDHQPWTAGTTE